MTVSLLLLLSATCDPLPSLPSLLYPPSLASMAPGGHVWVAVASTDERVPVLLSDGEAVDATSRRYAERTRAVIELSPQGRLRPGARIALKLGEEVLATGEVGEPKVMVPWSGRGLVRWAKRAWGDECVNAGPFLVMEASATYLYLVSEGPRCQGPEFPAVLTRDGPPEEYITDRINWPALVIGDERRGVEPILVFDPSARGTATVCLRAVDEEGNRSPPVRLTFDRSNPQHFGCLLLFNVKVTPRPLPPYEPGKVLEHAPSPDVLTYPPLQVSALAPTRWSPRSRGMSLCVSACTKLGRLLPHTVSLMLPGLPQPSKSVKSWRRGPPMGPSVV